MEGGETEWKTDTRKFNAAKEKDEEIHHILTSVYTALEENGL